MLSCASSRVCALRCPVNIDTCSILWLFALESSLNPLLFLVSLAGREQQVKGTPRRSLFCRFKE